MDSLTQLRVARVSRQEGMVLEHVPSIPDLTQARVVEHMGTKSRVAW